MAEIDALNAQWTQFRRPYELLSEWTDPRGILFTAKDGSGDEAAEATAKLLCPDKVFRLEGQAFEAWREELQLLHVRERQELLFEPTPKRICIIAVRLDGFSEDFYINLKGLFERSELPFCCLASATGPEKIPDYLRSHFFECRPAGC
jgi:hypothetical protein